METMDTSSCILLNSPGFLLYSPVFSGILVIFLCRRRRRRLRLSRGRLQVSLGLGLDLEELDFKDQRRTARDLGASPAVAVSHGRRDDELMRRAVQ